MQCRQVESDFFPHARQERVIPFPQRNGTNRQNPQSEDTLDGLRDGLDVLPLPLCAWYKLTAGPLSQRNPRPARKRLQIIDAAALIICVNIKRIPGFRHPIERSFVREIQASFVKKKGLERATNGRCALFGRKTPLLQYTLEPSSSAALILQIIDAAASMICSCNNPAAGSTALLVCHLHTEIGRITAMRFLQVSHQPNGGQCGHGRLRTRR